MMCIIPQHRATCECPDSKLGFFSAISSLDILTLRSFSELVHSDASKKGKDKISVRVMGQPSV
jgi:hypothetical protein